MTSIFQYYVKVYSTLKIYLATSYSAIFMQGCLAGPTHCHTLDHIHGNSCQPFRWKLLESLVRIPSSQLILKSKRCHTRVALNVAGVRLFTCFKNKCYFYFMFRNEVRWKMLKQVKHILSFLFYIFFYI